MSPPSDHVTALEDFLESSRSFGEEKTLNIAIFGRFEAGKSSFLNHLLGRRLVPVGVIPVTTVVTEIQYGPREGAEIPFLDGRTEHVTVERIGEFISESEDPENSKQVGRVRVGKIFDHTWEVLSFLLPMALVKGAVKRHFARKVGDAVFMNLSRLASQWEGIVNAALLALEKDAMRRLAGLIAAIDHLLASAGQEAPQIREDLQHLERLRDQLARGGG